MNFKVRCTSINKYETNFTIGEIYEVKGGVIFDDRGMGYKGWHKGNDGSFDELRNWFSKWYTFELVKESTPEIHITVKGNETIAVYKNNGKIKKAVAKCSPDDKFDFGIGAKLALERLGVLPVEKTELKYKVGDRVIVEESNIEWCSKYAGEIGTIIELYINENYEYPYLIKIETGDQRGACIYCSVKDYAPEEVPHATKMICSFDDAPYGECGTPTKFKDKNGEPLFVGDVVRVVNIETDMDCGEDCVVDRGGQFIMGIRVICNSNTGKIDRAWKITKTRSYKDMKPGDVVKSIKYI